MRDITSLCINICAVLSAVTTDTAPEPILQSIMKTIYKITLNRDWDEWIVACGSQMPNLHLHFYSFIDRIWALIATGATEFSNTNVVNENRPIADLNLAHHTKAVAVLKALVDQVTLHQSQGTPILVQASVATRYSPLAATGPIVPKPHTQTPATTETVTRRDNKRTPAAPAGGTNIIAPQEQNKKVKVVETRTKDRKSMGIFYLRNATCRASDVFPPDLEEKICVDWVCKERECTKDNCPFKHPRNPRDIKFDDNVKIGRHFAKTKKGWLSDYHFRNETNLPPDVLAMMGNSQGVTTK
jgi:hypothetical protein